MKKITIIAMILLVSISPLFRGLFFDLETYIFLSAIALLSLVYLFIKLIDNEKLNFNKWMLLFGFLFLLAYSLSFLKAVNIRENIRILMQNAEFYIMAVILYDYFHDKKQLHFKVIMLPVAITGFICALVGLEAMTSDLSFLGGLLSEQRIGATFQYYNTAAIYYIVCLLFSIALVMSSENLIIKVLMAGAGNILFIALMFTGTRGAYIAFVVLIIVIWIMQPSGYKIAGIANLAFIFFPAFIVMKKFSVSAKAQDIVSANKWLLLSFSIVLAVSLIFNLLSRYISNKYFGHNEGSGQNKGFGYNKGSGNNTGSGHAKKHIAKYIIAISMVPVLFLIFYYRNKFTSLLPQNIIERITTLNMESESYVNRMAYYKDSLKLIADNWIFGLGGGGWSSLYQSVQDKFYIANYVHNSYLQVFVEAGILAVIAYISLIITSAAYFVKSYVRTVEKTQKILIAGLFCGFAGLALHSAIDFNMSFASIALLFWMLMAIAPASIPANYRGMAVKKDASGFLVQNRLSKIAFIAAASILLSLNGLYSTAAYNARKGFDNMDRQSYKSAVLYYEEAYRLDRMNPEYTFKLAKLYNYLAEKNTNPEYSGAWLSKARKAAKISISLDSNFPLYREMLAHTYSKSGMPVQALAELEKLVTYQRCNYVNYELLAKGYLEAADYYNKNGEKENAKKILQNCLEIDRIKYVILTSEISKDKEKAAAMLKEIDSPDNE